MTKKFTLPNMLAFERKLEPSDALMFSGVWGDGQKPQMDNWTAIKVAQRKNLSTQSAFGTKDEDKTKPNPV
ncbi:type I-F CRISPR-associated protein Cas7f/Csy3, partial [Vibrio cholerae]